MKVKDARKGWATTNIIYFQFHHRLFLIHYQLKSNLHNFGKCLENMKVKQKQEHSTTRRQHFVIIYAMILASTFSDQETFVVISFIHVVLSALP